MEGSQSAPSAALLATARSLAMDSAGAEAATAFAEAGIPSVLLKGPALAAWLYDDGTPRAYGDADLLVAPWHMPAAREILGRLGFERVPEAAAPGETEPHAEPWGRAQDEAEIDLHRTLFGMGVAPTRVWSRLSRLTERMDVGGARVDVLASPGRELLVAVHAAQHGRDRDKPREDLERALARTDDATWSAAARLAHDLHAEHTLARGLRSVPEGEAMADRLRLPSGPLASVRAQHSPAAAALGFARLAATRGVRAKLALALREIAPSPDDLRWAAPEARRGRAALAAAYARRGVWLATNAAGGFVAWRRLRSGSP